MYSLKIYKNGMFQNEKTGKQIVTEYFEQDIRNCKPTNIRHTKNSVIIAFCDSKFTCIYTLPNKYIWFN